MPQRFRFGQALDYRDLMFLVGGAKYLDVPGLSAWAVNGRWVKGEGKEPEGGEEWLMR